MGGFGNIGQSFISSLDKKKNIFIFDKNFSKKKFAKNINLIKGNSLKKKDLNKIPKKIDVAFFLIGLTGGQKSLDIMNMEKYLKYNCETLILFLDIIKNRKIKKIIFSSTEHVYGDYEGKFDNPQTFEPYPKNYYGASKLLSEKILYNFYTNHKIDIDILRIPRVISNKNNLIYKMINSAIQNKIIHLGNSKAEFNFIFLSDLLKVFNICLMQKNKGFRILNIFNDSKPISLKSIAKKIAINLKKKVKINFLNQKNFIEHNPLNLSISNYHSKKKLKWKPLFTNDKIIKHLIKNYES